LAVRYRNCTPGDIVTTPVNELLSIDNGNGTSTYYICVLQGSSYASPVCVEGGIEVSCPVSWDMGGSCGSGGTTTTTAAPTTTTTTAAGGGTIVINNNASFGANIDDFTPGWFLIDTGFLPVEGGSSASGTHSGYVGDIGINLSGIAGGDLTLYVNSAFIQQVFTSTDGLYSFVGVTIGSSDSVQIDYNGL
jgi:hypothetical protein